MKFDSDTIAGFLDNEYFIQWVLNPDKESERFWTRWINAHPHKAKLLFQAKELVLSYAASVSGEVDQERLEVILDNVLMHHQSSKKEVSRNVRKQIRGSRSLTRGTVVVLAACFIMALIFSASYFGVLHFDEGPQAPVEVEWTTKSTVKGVKSTFYLPDGTKVKLNSSSELSFPSIFSDSLREVRLVGQGFFEVTKDENKPFVVVTEELKVQVLGTSFDVEVYKDALAQQVTVLTGKVSVETNTGITEMLLPSERVRLSADKNELIKTTVDADFLSGWKDGVLVFDRDKFEVVFRNLEEWYGVDIELDEDVKLDGTFTGHYENESLENILEGISYTKKFNFSINGKKVYIKR